MKMKKTKTTRIDPRVCREIKQDLVALDMARVSRQKTGSHPAPEEGQALISKTCTYFILHGKTDFADLR